MFLPKQIPLAQQTEADPYPEAFSSLMSNVAAVRDDDITHSYAWVRRKANGEVATNYPALRYTASPRPNWFVNPERPTEAEFDSARDAIHVLTERDDNLDDTDLVLATISGTEDTTPSTFLVVGGGGKFYVVGPSTVTVTSDRGVVSVTDYPAGLTTFTTGNATVSHSGGSLFLSGFPAVRKDPYFGVGQGNHFIYVPTRLEGEVVILGGARVTIYDAGIRLDILPGPPPTSTLLVGPGVITIDNVNTRGGCTLANCNKYISSRSDVMLMPRVFAVEDGLAFAEVTVPGDPDPTPEPSPGEAVWLFSTVLIVTDAQKDNANRLFCAMNLDNSALPGRTFSIGLNYTGSGAATHWACHGIFTTALITAIADGKLGTLPAFEEEDGIGTVPSWEDFGLTEATALQAFTAMTNSTITNDTGVYGLDHFDEAIAANSLMRTT